MIKHHTTKIYGKVKAKPQLITLECGQLSSLPLAKLSQGRKARGIQQINGRHQRQDEAMYVARLHNHCVNGNTALCSLCTVKQPVISNIIKILTCFTTMLLWQTDIVGNNNMFLGLHVNHQYFCPMLIKFQFSSQILKKDPTSYFTKIYPEKVMLISENRQMDGHDEGEICFS